MNEITLKKDIARFSNHMKKGADHIQAACKIYADAVMNDHTAVYEFERAFPYITQSTWDKMRLAGTGAIEARIIMLSDRLGAKLIRLPLDEQRRLMIEDEEQAERGRKQNIRHWVKRYMKKRGITEKDAIKQYKVMQAFRAATRQSTETSHELMTLGIF